MAGMTISQAQALDVRLEPGLDGATHMQRDRELLQAQQPHDAPLLRLYTWSPPAVSLGHMQKAEELLDLEACHDAGVHVVRRPTGGRAILHAEEITYALVASTHDARFGSSLAAAHAVLGACLARGLRELGIEARLARPEPHSDRRLLRQPCFASAGRAEIVVQGRKLLGSAQRRSAHAFLQHGSLLIGPAHEGVVDLLLDARRDAAVRQAMQSRLRRDTVTLRELLGSDPSFETLAAALVRGFSTELGLRPRYLS